MSQNYESFGKYILLEKLAMGGMAEIYLAKSSGASGVSKFVAIKRILPQFTEQTEFIDMFKDEAKIAVNLSHANVVSIFEFGIEKSAFYLTMDYIEGRNLRQILNKMKKSNVSFSIEQVLYIIKEVASGLDHAHRCIDANTGKPLNIIHRDMSPQNVMVSFEGEVKIVDFGIAKAETQLETTRAGTLKGKFGYMSPEQAEGQQVDLRTDIFALGIVLWELLANDRLFVANNEVNTLRKIRDCQIPSLRKINPLIPQELERIVSKALAKDRHLRYQTAGAFHRELSRFLNRQFPDFSPQDFSIFIKNLFSNEILDSRKKMVEYGRLDAPSHPAAGPVTPQERTVVTQTGADENTGSDVDFGNAIPKAHEISMPALRNDFRPPPPAVNFTDQKPAVAIQASSSAIQQPQGQSQTLSRRGELPPSLNPDNRNPFRDNAQSGLRDGSMISGTRSVSRASLPRSESNVSSTVSLMLMLMAFGGLLGGGAYYYTNPSRATTQVTNAMINLGLYSLPPTQQSPIDQASVGTKPATSYVDVSISSSPSGAPIEIDGSPSGEVTPATLQFAKGRIIKISIRLPGYLKFEQTLAVDGPKSVVAEMRTDKKGFLNVVVRGEGQIYINNQLVATTSPARMIAVAAGENVTVVAYDPKTQASDQLVTSVDEGATRTITLSPHAASTRPQKQ